MRILILAALIILFTSIPALQQTAAVGAVRAAADTMVAELLTNRFGGWIIITPGDDWRQQWQTPAKEIPQFRDVQEVGLGQKVTILTLFTHPQTDDNGFVTITCDLAIKRPDGTLSYDEKEMACATGALESAPGNIFLSQVVIDFVGELTDPYGVWTIEMVLKDKNSGAEVLLVKTFELVDRSRLVWQLVH